MELHSHYTPEIQIIKKHITDLILPQDRLHSILCRGRKDGDRILFGCSLCGRCGRCLGGGGARGQGLTGVDGTAQLSLLKDKLSCDHNDVF